MHPSRTLQHSIALASISLVGCASYEPAPLELEDFAAAWHAEFTPVDADAEDHVVWDRDRAERELLLRHRGLVAQRRTIEVARADREFAGLAPDPTLSLSALRILSGGPDPWLFGAGFAWDWPFAHLRSARVDRAGAVQRAAEYQLAAAELDALAELGIAWAGVDAAQRALELERRFVTEFERLAASLESLSASGELTGLDAGLARLEVTRSDNRRRRAAADLALRKIDLSDVLAVPGEAPLEFAIAADRSTPTPRAPGPLSTHPEIAAAKARYDITEQTLRREVAEQFPGFSIGREFEHEEGEPQLGLGVSIPLPLWNRNQGGIAVARAERDAARAAAERSWIELAQARLRFATEFDSAQQILANIDQLVTPEVTRQISSARRLIDAGEVSTALLLDVLRQARDAGLSRIEARLRLAVAAAGLRRSWSPAEEDDTGSALDPAGDR